MALVIRLRVRGLRGAVRIEGSAQGRRITQFSALENASRSQRYDIAASKVARVTMRRV
jgi:hypothetical protein